MRAGKRRICSIIIGALLLGPFSRADFEAMALVEPVWEATLASTVLGRVQSIEVKETQRVEADSILLTLERSFEELDMKRRQIVAESKVEMELARSKLALLRIEFEGTKKIYENSGSISKEEYERAKLDLLLAESELDQLLQREKIELLEWELAKEQVSRREIRAPQAGIVVEVFPEVGEVCEPRQPLLRIVDTSSVKLTLEIDALKTAYVVAGARVPVMVDAPGGEIAVEGVIDFISPVVDGASGLRRIRIKITNEAGTLLPGLSARVQLKDGN